MTELQLASFSVSSSLARWGSDRENSCIIDLIGPVVCRVGDTGHCSARGCPKRRAKRVSAATNGVDCTASPLQRVAGDTENVLFGHPPV
jgi:hypothetical protein